MDGLSRHELGEFHEQSSILRGLFTGEGRGIAQFLLRARDNPRQDENEWIGPENGVSEPQQHAQSQMPTPYVLGFVRQHLREFLVAQCTGA